MSANVEWDIPFTLTTAGHTINMNTFSTTGDLYRIDRAGAITGPGLVSGTAIRRARDFIPQADGEIKHNDGFKPGYEMRLPLQLWNTPSGGTEIKPACESQLRGMMDNLAGACDELMRGEGQIAWTPSGAPNRLLNKISLLSWPAPSIDDADGLVTVDFEVFTEFPYAIDQTEGTPATFTADAAAITQAGNTNSYPVFQVQGATNAFVLTNTSVLDALGNPLQIIYDSGLPGGTPIAGGSYVEIDCFRNTMYLNGSGANLKPNLDVVDSEFFWLKPGANNLTITWTDGTGAGVTVLWNNAWA